MDAGFLAHNRADTASTHDGPDEESDAGYWDKVRLDGEEMANLVHGEPDCWKRAEPEDEKGNPISGGGARGFREGVGDRVPVL